MKQRFNLKNFYKTSITTSIPSGSSTDTDEHNFSVIDTVSKGPLYVIVDGNDQVKRDVIFIHRVENNKFYYYNYNRSNNSISHQANSLLEVNDLAEYFNYIFKNIEDFGEVKKKTGLDINVRGGKLKLNQDDVNIDDTDITLDDNTTNYIILDYTDNSIKKVTSTDGLVCVILSEITTNSGTISNIIDKRQIYIPTIFNDNDFIFSNGEVKLKKGGINKVKTDDDDPTSGYLIDKVDGNTLDVDTTNHKIIVKDGIFAKKDLSNVSDNDVLDKIKNVDGEDSGLDADLLDGKQASDFAETSHTHSWNDVNKDGSKLSDIADIPDYTNERYLYIDGNGNLTWNEGGGGASNFTNLSDTPDSYDDAADKYVRVNSDGNGLIFVDGTSSDDSKEVLVSSNDTTEGYLEDKITGGNNITITTLNDGDNEQVQVAVDTSGLNADKVDNKDVDDTKTDDTALWTAQKIGDEITNATSGKADKVGSATDGNFAGLDSDGNIKDSGKKADDFAEASHTHTLGALSDVDTSSVSDGQVLGYDANNSIWKSVDQNGGSGDDVNTRKYLWLQTFGTKSKGGGTTVDISGKADKVSNVTDGNFAGLNSNGNLTDSGHSDSDYVHTSLDETIDGIKTLNNPPKINNITQDDAQNKVLVLDNSSNEVKLRDVSTIGGQKIFDAIVSGNGDGDYTTLSAALNDGHGSIFIKKGSYSETITSSYYLKNINVYIEFDNNVNYSITLDSSISSPFSIFQIDDSISDGTFESLIVRGGEFNVISEVKGDVYLYDLDNSDKIKDEYKLMILEQQVNIIINEGTDNTLYFYIKKIYNSQKQIIEISKSSFIGTMGDDGDGALCISNNSYGYIRDCYIYNNCSTDNNEAKIYISNGDRLYLKIGDSNYNGYVYASGINNSFISTTKNIEIRGKCVGLDCYIRGESNSDYDVGGDKYRFELSGYITGSNFNFNYSTGQSYNIKTNVLNGCKLSGGSKIYISNYSNIIGNYINLAFGQSGVDTLIQIDHKYVNFNGNTITLNESGSGTTTGKIELTSDANYCIVTNNNVLKDTSNDPTIDDGGTGNVTANNILVSI